MKNIVFTITGRSASGKSTLEKALQETGLFGKGVSHTTRPMREGEVNGKDYYFVSVDEFKRMEFAGELIESIKFGDHYYGFSDAEVKRLAALGLPTVIVCEPHGRNQIAQYCLKYGYKYHAIHVHASPKTIAKRFISRLLNDANMVGDSSLAMKRLVNTYAERMANIETIESKWTHSEFPYMSSLSLETPEDQTFAVGWFKAVLKNAQNSVLQADAKRKQKVTLA